MLCFLIQMLVLTIGLLCLQVSEPGKVSNQINMPTYMRVLHELGVLPNILNKAQVGLLSTRSAFTLSVSNFR